MNLTNEVISADAELKVLDDAELDAVTGGFLNRNIVGLVNVGVGQVNVNSGPFSGQVCGTSVGVGQNTGNFSINHA